MPPKLKKRKTQRIINSKEESCDKETVKSSTSDNDDNEDDESGDTDESLTDEESEDTNADSDSDDDEEEEDDDDEEDEDGDDDDKDTDEEDEKKDDSKPKVRVADLFEKKKGKIVTMDYCTKHLYKGPIENIKDMLNGSAEEEFEIKEEAPVKNDPAFKNVSKKWGWKQEVMLLEGIEANGLFNWELIAEQLSKKTRKKFKPDEVKNHYYQYYYNGTLGQVWDYKLEETPFKHFDHTDPIVVNVKKYLPQVAVQHLREIKFLPHREDFEHFPLEEIEKMLTHVDFSSFYLNNMKSLKIDQEVRNLQLVIVDAYRDIVASRMKVYKLMQDFKLIEQFFLNMQNKNFKKCAVDKHFATMQKFIGFFDSPNDFIKFYVDCVREKLLKIEIARLHQVLATKRKKERDPEMKTMLKKRAPCCFSMLTKILYCTGLKRERKNSNSQKGREHDEVFIYALPTLLEGLKLRFENMISLEMLNFQTKFSFLFKIQLVFMYIIHPQTCVQLSYFSSIQFLHFHDHCHFIITAFAHMFIILFLGIFFSNKLLFNVH